MVMIIMTIMIRKMMTMIMITVIIKTTTIKIIMIITPLLPIFNETTTGKHIKTSLCNESPTIIPIKSAVNTVLYITFSLSLLFPRLSSCTAWTLRCQSAETRRGLNAITGTLSGRVHFPKNTAEAHGFPSSRLYLVLVNLVSRAFSPGEEFPFLNFALLPFRSSTSLFIFSFFLYFSYFFSFSSSLLFFLLSFFYFLLFSISFFFIYFPFFLFFIYYPFFFSSLFIFLFFSFSFLVGISLYFF